VLLGEGKAALLGVERADVLLQDRIRRRRGESVVLRGPAGWASEGCVWASAWRRPGHGDDRRTHASDESISVLRQLADGGQRAIRLMIWPASRIRGSQRSSAVWAARTISSWPNDQARTPRRLIAFDLRTVPDLDQFQTEIDARPPLLLLEKRLGELEEDLGRLGVVAAGDEPGGRRPRLLVGGVGARLDRPEERREDDRGLGRLRAGGSGRHLVQSGELAEDQRKGGCC